MRMSIIALAAIGFMMVDAVAVAHNVPMRDMNLLALNTDSPRNALDPAGPSSLIDSSDSGGGSTGARARRGMDGGTAMPSLRAMEDPASADSLPPRVMPFEDPSQPAAPTPKRPSYRWQSLVPGAIK